MSTSSRASRGSFVIVLLALAAVACGSEDGAEAGACTPGASQACACTDGSTGAQTCKTDGSGFEPCACGPATDAVTGGDARDVAVDDGAEPDGGCAPACADKTCGPDGCGGSCGACTTGVCLDGNCCVAACTGKTCGPDGCGGSCGACAAGVCLDGNCCVPSCAGRECGPDGCGGSCGACPAAAPICESFTCHVDCVPDCVVKQCGSDGCGGSCGACPEGQFCVDFACDGAPTDWTCSEYYYDDGSDCDCECGAYDPDCANPYAPVYGCYGGGGCDASGHCGPCTPDCTYQECGDDGCGGSCGWCEDGYCTYYGECCVPDCDGKACGPDGCDGVCGTCDYGACVDGACECTPSCDGKECGGDGCGGSCGECLAGTCLAWKCCEPSCDGKVCGGDGCGGSCGTCEQGICDGAACGEAKLGTMSRLDALYIPGTGDETGATVTGKPTLAGAFCPDLTDDGFPDNGAGALLTTLTGFGVDVNAELDMLVTGDTSALVLDFGGLTSTSAAEPFTVAGYFGVVEGDPAGLAITTDSFDPNGKPLFFFESATLAGGHLTAGPSSVAFPLLGTPALAMNARIEKARLTASVSSVSAAGVEFAGGVLSGVAYKADLDRMLYQARLWCMNDPQAPADACGYIQMADMSLIETFLTWDLEVEGCGKMLQIYDANDPMVVVGEEENCLAVTICVFLSGTPAVVTGTTTTAGGLGCGCDLGAGGAPLSARLGAVLLAGFAAALVAVRRRRIS